MKFSDRPNSMSTYLLIGSRVRFRLSETPGTEGRWTNPDPPLIRQIAGGGLQSSQNASCIVVNALRLLVPCINRVTSHSGSCSGQALISDPTRLPFIQEAGVRNVALLHHLLMTHMVTRTKLSHTVRTTTPQPLSRPATPPLEWISSTACGLR